MILDRFRSERERKLRRELDEANRRLADAHTTIGVFQAANQRQSALIAELDRQAGEAADWREQATIAARLIADAARLINLGTTGHLTVPAARAWLARVHEFRPTPLGADAAPAASPLPHGDAAGAGTTETP